MKIRFDWMQLVRLLVMVVAVAAVIYALEYLPASPLMWISVGVLILGFVMMLFAFRVAQRPQAARGKEASRTKQTKRS